MNLTERIAYIRGLAEGLKLDENKDEVKVINAIIDLLEDMAYDVVDMEEIVDDVCNQVDEIDEDLAEVEDELYGDDYETEWEYDDDEDALIEGELKCPMCGAEFEFDFSELQEDIDAIEEADKKADEKADDKAEDKEEKK